MYAFILYAAIYFTPLIVLELQLQASSVVDHVDTIRPYDSRQRHECFKVACHGVPLYVFTGYRSEFLCLPVSGINSTELEFGLRVE